MDLPDPERRPPRGVPRWLWPPPGAVVRRVVVREETAAGSLRHHLVEGEAPEPQHLRQLQWLLADYVPDEGAVVPHAVTDVLLEIAETSRSVPSSPVPRRSFSYALNGQALGAPANEDARAILWRYAQHVLGRAPLPSGPWREEDF